MGLSVFFAFFFFETRVPQIFFEWMRNDSPEDASHRIFVQDAATLGLDGVFFPAAVAAVGVAVAAAALAAERGFTACLAAARNEPCGKKK